MARAGCVYIITSDLVVHIHADNEIELIERANSERTDYSVVVI